MIVLTVVIHTAGVVGLVGYLKGATDPAAGRPLGHAAVLRLLVLTILAIFLLHTIEVWCWALLYLWLGEFAGLERALYFSTVTFTTLGYGDITLAPRWQMLSSLEAVNGIILFGVSTAFVFAVLRKLFAAAALIKPE